MRNHLLCFALAAHAALGHPAIASSLHREDIRELFRDFEEVQYVLNAFVGVGATNKPEKLYNNHRSTTGLVRKIKRSPHGDGIDKAGRTLAARGHAALPLLLEELRGSAGMYRGCLVNILTAIDAPERDAAFVEQLEKLLHEEPDNSTSAMMRTLAARETRAAIPILKRLTEHNAQAVRSEARFALGLMGEIALAPGAEHYTVKPGVDDGRNGDQFNLLEVLLGYEILNYAPLLVVDVVEKENELILMSGRNANPIIDEFRGIPLAPELEKTIPPAPYAAWSIQFGPAHENRVPFYYVSRRRFGESGHIGVLEKQGDHWVLEHWEYLYHGRSDGTAPIPDDPTIANVPG